MMNRTQPRMRVSWQQVVVAAIVALYLTLYVISEPFDALTFGVDIAGYDLAAERILDGQGLYYLDGLDGNEEYRYAPWFAYAWIGLRLMPDPVWVAAGLVALAWLAWPLRRSVTALLVAGLIAPPAIEYAWRGNVDPFVLLALAVHDRKAGPMLVGLAASLKIAPIAFVLVYVVRREWSKAAVAMAVAGLLWLPALTFDLSQWSAAPTPYSPMQYGMAVGLAWAAGLGMIALLTARRHPVFAAVVLMLALTPRLHLYSLGNLLIPARDYEVL